MSVPRASRACLGREFGGLRSAFALVRARIAAVGFVDLRTVRVVRRGVAMAGGLEVRPWLEDNVTEAEVETAWAMGVAIACL